MCGTGERGGRPGSRPSLSPPAIGEDFGGVSRVGVGAARQPTLQTQRLQLAWRGISHFKWQAFVLAPACPVPQASCQARERAAGRRAAGSAGPGSRWSPGLASPSP